MSADLTDDRQAKRNVAVLVAAQAILGGQMPQARWAHMNFIMPQR